MSQAGPHPTPGPAPLTEGLWPGENLLLRLWPGRKSPGRTLPLAAWTSSPICSVHRNATQQPPTCPWSLGLNLPLCIWRQPSTPGPHRARSRNQTPEHPGLSSGYNERAPQSQHPRDQSCSPLGTSPWWGPTGHQLTSAIPPVSLPCRQNLSMGEPTPQTQVPSESLFTQQDGQVGQE